MTPGDNLTQNPGNTEQEPLHERAEADVELLDFLKNNNISRENISIEAAIKYASSAKEDDHQEANAKMKEGLEICNSKNIRDVFDQTDRDRVLSELDLNLSKGNISNADKIKVLAAWESFDLIRQHMDRVLAMMENMKNARKETLTETTSLTDGIKEKLGFARENWDKLDTGQKLLVAGISLGAAIFLATNDNDTVKKIRKGLMYGAGALGGAWLLNKFFYLITGESVPDYVAGAKKGSEFLAKAYNTDEKGSELMAQSFVCLGNIPFPDLLAAYEDGLTSKKLVGIKTTMSEADSFTAFDLFVKKYGLVNLKEAYLNHEPVVTFDYVAALEMAKDPTLKVQEGITKRTAEGVKDYFWRSYNYVAGSGPALWLEEKYKDWTGKEPTKEELADFAKRFGVMVETENKVTQALEDNLVQHDKKLAKKYVDTYNAGIKDQQTGISYRVDNDGYVYAVLHKKMENINGDEKKYNSTIQNCVQITEKFFSNNFQTSLPDVASKTEVAGTVFSVDDTTVHYFVRFKK